MASLVTPWAVAPPLSAPSFHATTHAGALIDGNLICLVFASQSGFFSAAALLTPGALDDCATAAVPVVVAKVPQASAVLTNSSNAR